MREKTSIANRRMMMFICVVMMTSSIVFMEPAPYDLLFVVLFVGAFLFGYVVFHEQQLWPFILLLAFVQANLISMFFSHDLLYALHYFLITFYLIMTWVLFVGLSSYYREGLFPPLFKAYTLAALVAVVAGLLAYFQWIPGTELFLKYGRVTAFFKDPNVFGPFLIPPALFALYQASKRDHRLFKSLSWFSLFVLLTMGIILSFSRAAWGNFALALGVYLLLIKGKSVNRLRPLFLIVLVAIPGLGYFITSPTVENLFQERFSIQSYDYSRFENQENALENIVHFPLGFGPGHSEIMLDFAAHSLYIRVMVENGVLGGIAFILFLLACLWRSLSLVLTSLDEHRGIYVVIFASILGIVFNSFFVDTLHWRHFWLLLALPWLKTDVRKLGG
ncbi:O-antigen ligase family protein [Ornithinibacillus halophilus]|uniref:O-Antigen ligase n=1 Tax=Ornithinibacillus halophilus TaxID=930117 RepID=A0A1M5KKB4_9BACI|nr:O-antigen ligase family protein [Ornithinibacillus halophilus]SHG53237.1 O-Antigen ligase [Ornithinibacillus halophilus]